MTFSIKPDPPPIKKTYTNQRKHKQQTKEGTLNNNKQCEGWVWGANRRSTNTQQNMEHETKTYKQNNWVLDSESGYFSDFPVFPLKSCFYSIFGPLDLFKRLRATPISIFHLLNPPKKAKIRPRTSPNRKPFVVKQFHPFGGWIWDISGH